MSKRGRKDEENATEADGAAQESEPVQETETKSKGSPSSGSGILSNRKLLYAIILIAIVAIAAWRLSTFTIPDDSTGLTGSIVSSGGYDGVDIGTLEAGNKLVDFLQARLETQYPGIAVALKDVQDVMSQRHRKGKQNLYCIAASN